MRDDLDNIWLWTLSMIAWIAVLVLAVSSCCAGEETSAPTATPAPTMTSTPTPTNTPTPRPTKAAIVPRILETEESRSITCLDSGLIAPSEEEVEYIAKVIHGEAGICSKLQKSAVAWCVCNRVDCADYPDNVIDVITQPCQFYGYTEYEKPTAEDYEIAWSVLYRWLNNLEGRTLPKNYLYFHSNGKGENIFTTNYRKGDTWDWSLPNIYDY